MSKDVSKMTKPELRAYIDDLQKEHARELGTSNTRQQKLFEIERQIRVMLFEIDGREDKADLEESQVELLKYVLSKYKEKGQANAEWEAWAKRTERNWENLNILQGGPEGSRHRIGGELTSLRNENRMLKAHTRFGFAVRNVGTNEIEFVIRNADLASIVTKQAALLVRAHPIWEMSLFIRDGDTCIRLTYNPVDPPAIRDDNEYVLLLELHNLIFEPLIYEVNGNPRPSVDAEPRPA